MISEIPAKRDNVKRDGGEQWAIKTALQGNKINFKLYLLDSIWNLSGRLYLI